MFSGCLTSPVFSRDELGIEGDRHEVPCDCASVISIQHRSVCDNSYHVEYWEAPNSNGCGDNTGYCVRRIGGFCADETSSINACWRNCMSIDSSMTLVIYPVKDPYSFKTGMRGTVTCRPTVAYIEYRAVGIQ